MMDSDAEKFVQTEFLAFAMKAFAVLNKGRCLDNEPYLKLAAQVLTKVAAGKTKRLVLSMPPRHAKTFMASICLPAWILAHNSSAKILVLSYGHDLAERSLMPSASFSGAAGFGERSIPDLLKIEPRSWTS